MKKRIGSFFLAIVMLFTLVVPAFAQSITLGKCFRSCTESAL